MRSQIKTNDEFAQTQSDMLRWWEGYGAQFKTVVNRYTNKLSNNPVYGQVRDVVIDPETNQPLKINGVVQFKTREGQLDANGETVNFRYDGRLSRLFTIDFGDNPDFSAEEGTQGLWDSLGEHEKLILRSNEDFMTNTFTDTFGTTPINKDTTIMASPTQILEERENTGTESTEIDSTIQQYRDYNWWETTTNPVGVIEADIGALWGENPESGVWKIISEELPEFKNIGHQDLFKNKGALGLMQQYRGRVKDNMNPAVEKIFIKIEAMYDAIKKGEKFLKESKKTKSKLEEPK